MNVPVLFALVIPLLASCSMSVTREDALKTAYRYTQVEWMPEARHVLHGPDSMGIPVNTPDVSVSRTGGQRGWWRPGVAAKGMPYQWGGFDTPESFLAKIAAGKKAGDVCDASKCRLGDAGTSGDACGIDCSGFVSRCWNLLRPYSTRELPSICERLKTWDELKPGDILLNRRHVILFAGWITRGKIIAGYEAGLVPAWRVNARGIPKGELLREGYVPMRYLWMR